MAIVKNGQTKQEYSSTSDYITLSHTVTSGASILLMWIGNRSSSNRYPISAVWKTSETMTQKELVNDDAGEAVLTLYYLLNPTPGTYNVGVGFSAAVYRCGIAMDFSGVDILDPFNTLVTNSGVLKDGDVTFNGAADHYPLVGLCKKSTAESPVSDSEQSTIMSANSNNATDGNNAWCVVDTETGASSITSGWSWSINRYFALIGVSLKPAIGGSSGPEDVKNVNGVADWKTFNGVAKEDVKTINGISFSPWNWTKKGGLWLPRNPELITV